MISLLQMSTKLHKWWRTACGLRVTSDIGELQFTSVDKWMERAFYYHYVYNLLVWEWMERAFYYHYVNNLLLCGSGRSVPFITIYVNVNKS